MPTVSVIIPTRNRAELLKRAVKSVLNQTFQDFELIVVSDGSTDTTQAVVESFNDPRIIFFRHDTSQGASAARNTGLSRAQALYSAFLDDDDEWLPGKLEKQVGLIEELPDTVGMVYCWMDYYDRQGQIIHRHHPVLKGNVFSQVLDAQRLGGCPTLLVRRQVIKKVEGFDESLPRGNDGDFIRRICRECEVDLVPEVLVKVHVEHGSERITTRSSKRYENGIKAQKAKLEKFSVELQNLPRQKANILGKIGFFYMQLQDFYQARYYLFESIKTFPLVFRHYYLLCLCLAIPLKRKLIT